MKFRNYHIIIGALLFALLMWVSVNMTYEYTATYTIPIKVEHLPAGKILKYPIPQNLYLRLKGSGWHLTTLFISGNLELTIDGTKLTSNTVSYTDALVVENMKLPIPISIMDIYPDSLNFVIEDCLTKKVIVKPILNIGFMEGYGQVGKIEVSPDSILVSGSQSNIVSINDWKTKPVSLSNLSNHTHLKLTLQEPPAYIINIDQKEVDLKINVQPFAEKSYVGINIETLYLPANREVIFIPPKMDMILRGSIERLSNITNDSITAYVDFTSLVSDTTQYINPEVKLPDGVKIIKTFPDKFQFIIRKRL